MQTVLQQYYFKFYKMILSNQLLLSVLAQLVTLQLVIAQANYKAIPTTVDATTLSGTSSLHDWTMHAQSIVGNGQFTTSGKKLEQVNKLSLLLKVRDLKSKEKMMDNNAYKALKADQFKNITFELTSATVGQLENSKYPVTANGNLSIAGVTRKVTMVVWCEVMGDKSIACSGKEKLKMTDYQVKPPTFFFGEMKTGDELTLDFNLVFQNL